MKILLSPAKTLDYKSIVPIETFSQPIFENQANLLNKELKLKTPKQLSELMKISDKLAELNWKRNQNWETTKNFRQAVYAFKGAAYVGLNAYTIPKDKIDYLQSTLRILSGQYGILKPLDSLKPYRLEMGTKLTFDLYKSLYDFWGFKVTEVLNLELQDDEVVVNLASNEYFKVIKSKQVNTPIVTPIFKDYKNGEYKIISFFAKKARGLMTRFAIDNQIQEVNRLKVFTADGYAFDEKLSTDMEWVFTR